jgi:YD repeat-containing protein
VTAADGATAEGASSALHLDRYYNSLGSIGSITFGLQSGWTLSAGPDVSLTPGAGSVTASLPSGASATFTRNADGSYSSASTTAQLTLAGGTYTLRDPSGYVETFDATSGTQESVQGPGDTSPTAVYEDTPSGPAQTVLYGLAETAAGNSLTMSYNDPNPVRGQIGPLLSFTGSAGGTAQYGYNGTGQLVSFTTYTGARTTYGYNAAGRLTPSPSPTGPRRRSRTPAPVRWRACP